ncbi:MAG: RimK family alpha-L-glutamate ligase [Candidatus Nanohaloarchaea archaeon]
MKCENIAVMWDSEVNWDRSVPFREDIDHMNRTYRVFSELVLERRSKAYIANFSWYDSGRLEKAYHFDGDEWRKVEDVPVDVVFDKYKFDDETVPLKKEIQEEKPVLNDFRLEEICKDKLLSYQEFPELLPETREATEENVEEMLEEYGRVIVKPRFDYGGTGIEVLEDASGFETGENKLVQRFVDSSQGINELGIEGVHDLRVYVLNGENMLAYVRTPEEGLLSNVHLGGSITFVELEDVPEAALETVERVKDSFGKYAPSLYSVDMLFDSSGEVWILEFNSKPGLAFYDDEEIRQRKEPTMSGLVDSLVDMC